MKWTEEKQIALLSWGETNCFVEVGHTAPLHQQSKACHLHSTDVFISADLILFTPKFSAIAEQPFSEQREG